LIHTLLGCLSWLVQNLGFAQHANLCKARWACLLSAHLKIPTGTKQTERARRDFLSLLVLGSLGESSLREPSQQAERAQRDFLGLRQASKQAKTKEVGKANQASKASESAGILKQASQDQANKLWTKILFKIQFGDKNFCLIIEYNI